MSKTIKVFVSSTFNDLKHHRARVIRQLRDAGFHVDPMEDWPADAIEPTKFCPEHVRGCDLCVLLVGFRRGWVPEPKGANRSITQMEYDEAIRLGVDVLPFFLADDVKDWPAEFDERADPEVKKWRDALRPQAGNERFHFRTEPNSVDVLPAVNRWQHRQKERERLADYLKCVADAHKTINFLGLPTFKENPDVEIGDLFVEPALATREASPDRDPKEWEGVTSLFDAVMNNPRLIVLGDPGTGKSTLVNWIVYQLARPEPNAWKVKLGSPIPLPFILRDLGIGRGITWDALLDKFLAGPAHHNLKKEQLLQLLEDGRTMFFLDGLDEIGDLRTREDLRKVVHEGHAKHRNCRWLLTSRIVGYDEVQFEDYSYGEFTLPPPPIGEDEVLLTEPLELGMSSSASGVRLDSPAFPRNAPSDSDIRLESVWRRRFAAPFNTRRIEEFAKKWYAIREKDPHKVKRDAAHLVEAIHRDPDTLRLGRIPNLLTMMALVHRVKAALPHGKALLYDYVAEAYLESIDEFRKLRRDTDSLRDKKRWLGKVAFEMQLRRAAAKSEEEQANAIVLNGKTLLGWLKTAMTETGGVPDADDPARFLERVRKRSGLMIERSPDRFAFTHLSFQEYFAAVYLQEWVTSAEWLTGEEVATGTSAADLRRYGNQTVWQVALVFLFELIADSRPLGKKKVREAVFGQNWEAIELGTEQGTTAAVLLAKLADNPHVNWDDPTRTDAHTHGLDWTSEIQSTGWTINGADVLRVFLGGEPASIHTRLIQVSARWMKDGSRILDLSGTQVSDPGPVGNLGKLNELYLHNTRVSELTSLAGLTDLRTLSLMNTTVSDLGPLAGLTKLQKLYLNDTRVSDLGPLAGLTKFQALYLDGTRVSDLGPLAGLTKLQRLFLNRTRVLELGPLASLTKLQRLCLDGTRVSDLEPLAGLTGLKELDLNGTPATDEEVERLQAKLPKLKIIR